MRDKFKAQYVQLFESFAKKLEDRNLTGIPAPHIPVIGRLYEKARVKIAFFGIETRGWVFLDEFMERYKKSPAEAYDCLTDVDNAWYLEWRNNFRSSFFDYITTFLTNFYSLDSSVFNSPEGKNLISSFIWGNTNAIERFGTSAQENEAKFEDWEQVKKASEPFDTARYVLDICRPDVLVILNWTETEEWLTGKAKIKPETLGDHHCYYGLPHTHVYWTTHPNWLYRHFDFTESAQLFINDLAKRGLCAPENIFFQ
jgi:hypothetical protein